MITICLLTALSNEILEPSWLIFTLQLWEIITAGLVCTQTNITLEKGYASQSQCSSCYDHHPILTISIFPKNKLDKLLTLPYNRLSLHCLSVLLPACLLISHFYQNIHNQSTAFVPVTPCPPPHTQIFYTLASSYALLGLHCWPCDLWGPRESIAWVSFFLAWVIWTAEEQQLFRSPLPAPVLACQEEGTGLCREQQGLQEIQRYSKEQIWKLTSNPPVLKTPSQHFLCCSCFLQLTCFLMGTSQMQERKDFVLRLSSECTNLWKDSH